MTRKETIKSRLNELFEKGIELKQNSQDYFGWMIAIQNIIQNICTENNPYFEQCSAIMRGVNGIKGNHSSIDGRGHIQGENRKYKGRMLSLLEEIKKDYDAGLLETVEHQIYAANFSEFLDHSKEYHRKGQKMESSVIVSAIFEDAVRKLGIKYEVEHKNLEQIINGLTRKSIIRKVKAKRIKSGSGLRDKSLHASWDEFDLNDVQNSINITEELLEMIENK